MNQNVTCLNLDCLSVSWMTSFEMFFGWYLSRMFFYVETPSLFHSDASSDCCYQRPCCTIVLLQVYLEFRPNKILRSTAENFSSSRIHKHLQANELHLKLTNLSTLFFVEYSSLLLPLHDSMNNNNNQVYSITFITWKFYLQSSWTSNRSDVRPKGDKFVVVPMLITLILRW